MGKKVRIRLAPGNRDRLEALIADNYATHKHPKVKAWLARHPRFHMHFTPTSASWLNLVERFFAEITRKRIRRGVFHSVADLQRAINDFLEHHNAEPKPFVWTASASSIIAKVNRGKQALDSQHWMARKVIEWPSNRGPITNIMPSDGCKGDAVPLAVGLWYNFHEVGCHLGNVG